eukprot:8062725-Pyramimonas_sp.AAC.1
MHEALARTKNTEQPAGDVLWIVQRATQDICGTPNATHRKYTAQASSAITTISVSTPSHWCVLD